jgi:8-oxo-dGTP pyrophosphatase MutT (NUDIX family)
MKTDHKLFQVSAKAFLFNLTRDKIILLKSAKGFWTAPGGHLENNEQPIDAARREIGEELGIDFRGDLTLKTADRYSPYEGLAKKLTAENLAKYEDLKNMEKIDLYFTGELDEKTPIDISESGDGLSEYTWAPLADIFAGKYEDWLVELMRRLV